VSTFNPSYSGIINRRITVQSTVSKEQDPNWKIVKAKRAGVCLSALVSTKPWVQTLVPPHTQKPVHWVFSFIDHIFSFLEKLFNYIPNLLVDFFLFKIYFCGSFGLRALCLLGGCLAPWSHPQLLRMKWAFLVSFCPLQSICPHNHSRKQLSSLSNFALEPDTMLRWEAHVF
jgi:hypothetical protein